MLKFRAARLFSQIAMILAVAMVVPLCASCVSAATVMPGQTTSVVIFPFDNTTSAGGKELGQSVATAIRSWLRLGTTYAPSVFAVTTPSIQRAKNEKRVDDATLEAPYDSAKALKLGKEMGADLVVTGAIEDYRYNKDAREVEITLTAQMISTRTGEDVSSPVVVTGVGKPSPGGEEESILAGKAVEDAVGKAVKSLAAVEKTNTATTPVKKKGGIMKNKSVWLFLVGAIGAAIALSSGGDNNTSGDPDLPPPPPL